MHGFLKNNQIMTSRQPWADGCSVLPSRLIVASVEGSPPPHKHPSPLWGLKKQVSVSLRFAFKLLTPTLQGQGDYPCL